MKTLSEPRVIVSPVLGLARSQTIMGLFHDLVLVHGEARHRYRCTIRNRRRLNADAPNQLWIALSEGMPPVESQVYCICGVKDAFSNLRGRSHRA